MENGVLVEKKYFEGQDLLAKEGSSKKWAPHNIAEYFFFDEFGFLTISDKKIYECYGEYTNTLAEVYRNLREIYQNFI